MAEIRTMDLGGQQRRVIEVAFETDEEEWARYKLHDGGALRVKYPVSRIWIEVDEDGEVVKSPFGDPSVFVDGMLLLAWDTTGKDPTDG
ncbi:MAG: hypothetical protein OXD50_04615 [Chloroflexi bacterium]|nr:hypothetical protein [Chloroflexota bacterium]